MIKAIRTLREVRVGGEGASPGDREPSGSLEGIPSRIRCPPTLEPRLPRERLVVGRLRWRGEVRGMGRAGDAVVGAGTAPARSHPSMVRVAWDGRRDRRPELFGRVGPSPAVAGFAGSPEVINGASDLLVQVFGEAGRHVRAALGLSGLPRNALVETQMTVEI